MTDCDAHEIRTEAFSYYPKLSQLLQYCEKHLASRLTLQCAADVVSLERTYFSTYFHDKVGVCYNCWLSNLRIGKAEELLQAQNYSISFVADKVGFNSIGTFQRNFKRIRGITPSAYKKQIRPC